MAVSTGTIGMGSEYIFASFAFVEASLSVVLETMVHEGTAPVSLYPFSLNRI